MEDAVSAGVFQRVRPDRRRSRIDEEQAIGIVLRVNANAPEMEETRNDLLSAHIEDNGARLLHFMIAQSRLTRAAFFQRRDMHHTPATSPTYQRRDLVP